VRRFWLLAAVAALLLSVACGEDEPKAGIGSSTPTATGAETPLPPNTVRVSDNSFSPSPLNVTAGTTVAWIQNGRRPHEVRSPSGLFASHPGCAAAGTEATPVPGCMSQGDEFRFTFTEPGTYAYYCRMHGFADSQGQVTGMTGRVIVT
jgi:plastocyanin